MFLEQGIAAYFFIMPLLIVPGAYFVQYLMSRFSMLSDYRLALLDKITIVYPLLMLLGFVFFILGLPDVSAFALFFNGIGQSSLSNFITSSSAFFVLSFLYSVISCIKSPSNTIRRIMLFILMVLGYTNIVFMSLVFYVPTVVTWNTPATIIFFLGVATLGGWSLASVVACIAGVYSDAISSSFKVPYRAIVYISIAAAILGITIVASVGAFASLEKASFGIPFDVSPGVMLNFVGAIIAFFLSGYCMHLATKTQLRSFFAVLSLLLIVAGIIMGIYVFETLYVSTGITQ